MLIRPAVEDDDTRPRSERLPEIAKTVNERLGHEGSFGSKPVDVIGREPERESGDSLLDF